MALDGSGKREQVLARSDVDVDGLVSIGRQSRVVGASFVTDKRQIEFFDPALAKLALSLSKALPGLPLVSIVDASADEGRLLLFAGSDTDPGHYYVFDKATHSLNEVLPVRPQLANVALSPVKPISYPAADGTMIPSYLTLPPGSDGKNLPAIVLPHGGPDSRDEWGFDWLPQFLAHRGYAVLQPNFRGSTGYGEAYFAKNGFQSWQVAIGDVTDAGRWLVKQGIADPAKLAIVGWSYGGYAALQSNVVDPALFKAVIAVAPVTDLETLREEHRDFTDFNAVDAQIGHGGHIRAGSPAQNAARFVAPVLMFHGDIDQNVGIGESRLMASRLKGAGKSVELVEYHHLTHQLDDSIVRAEMLDKMDGFLRIALHLPPAP
jgi:dipeptidyl aminopeptidase/acylaminoacyl peptidase